jgi:hypothetical protein
MKIIFVKKQISWMYSILGSGFVVKIYALCYVWDHNYASVLLVIIIVLKGQNSNDNFIVQTHSNSPAATSVVTSA